MIKNASSILLNTYYDTATATATAAIADTRKRKHGKRKGARKPGRRSLRTMIGKSYKNENTTDDDGDDFENRLELAVEEAREILKEATERSTNEARIELLAKYSETFRSNDSEDRRKGETTKENKAVNLARTQSYLEIKFKMRDFEAARVAKNLARSKSIYEDCDDLMVQMDRLEKALPGVNVGRLLMNDASVVSNINVATAVANMLLLYEFGFKRVSGMLEECPRLLLDNNEEALTLRERISIVTERIQSIFADETDDGCLYAIGEEPNLLFALVELDIFNREARVDIAELPMSVQGEIFLFISFARVFTHVFFWRTEMVVYSTRRFK
jgi:hypothetical protein